MVKISVLITQYNLSFILLCSFLSFFISFFLHPSFLLLDKAIKTTALSGVWDCNTYVLLCFVKYKYWSVFTRIKPDINKEWSRYLVSNETSCSHKKNSMKYQVISNTTCNLWPYLPTELSSQALINLAQGVLTSIRGFLELK